MNLKFFKLINPRIANIAFTIVQILIIVLIVSLALGLVLGLAGLGISGVFVLIFMFSLFMLLPFALAILILFVIEAVKRDGIKKTLKKILPLFLIVLTIALIINKLKNKDYFLIGSFFDALLPTIGLLIYSETKALRKQIDDKQAQDNADPPQTPSSEIELQEPAE